MTASESDNDQSDNDQSDDEFLAPTADLLAPIGEISE